MDLEKIDAGMAETVEQLKGTFSQLRTGEATPGTPRHSWLFPSPTDF
jgi:ribosome recycling factor